MVKRAWKEGGTTVMSVGARVPIRGQRELTMTGRM